MDKKFFLAKEKFSLLNEPLTKESLCKKIIHDYGTHQEFQDQAENLLMGIIKTKGEHVTDLPGNGSTESIDCCDGQTISQLIGLMSL